MPEVPEVDFIKPCEVVFASSFYDLDLCCGECYLGCLQFVCFVCFMFDCVC